MEHARGTADMQSSLARSRVGVEIKTNDALARKAEAEGEAAYIRETGTAKGAEVEAVGIARARAYKAQVEALGQTQTALVNVVNALADSKVKFIPDILVAGSGGGGSSMDGLAATLMKYVNNITPAHELIGAPTHGTGSVTPPRAKDAPDRTRITDGNLKP
jgi:uncharacterized membrane protein YqiK